jgi:hypothetical protein
MPARPWWRLRRAPVGRCCPRRGRAPSQRGPWQAVEHVGLHRLAQSSVVTPARQAGQDGVPGQAQSRHAGEPVQRRGARTP